MHDPYGVDITWVLVFGVFLNLFPFLGGMNIQIFGIFEC